jgi:hypothetical protein
MAQQKGAFPMQGTLGNVTFFKSQDGFLVKQKSAVSKDKIMSSPKFKRTRENMAEFGRAGKTGKYLRTPFKPLLELSSDNRMISRLVTLLLTIIHTDTTNKRGQRTVQNGNLSLLEGFEFNSKGILSTAFTAPYTYAYDRTTGNVTLDVASFVAAQSVQAPEGATHFKLQLAAGALDLSSNKNSAQFIESSVYPWDDTGVPAINLTLALPAASTLPVFALLQIQFLKQENTNNYQLQNGAYNACAIINVNTP